MKQNLTKLLVKPFVKEEETTKDSAEKGTDDVEYEQLFEGMETITEATKKKKSKRQEADDSGVEVIRKKKIRMKQT